MSEETVTEAMKPMKISFGVKKQIRSLVVEAAAPKKEDVEESESITHFEHGKVNGLDKPKKEEPVIPRNAKSNDWRIEKLQNAVNEGTATDEQRAMLELLLEASGKKPINGGSTEPSITVLNDAENGMDMDAEPDDIEPDYDAINIADFGNAFLRGRGWKKEEGLGKTNKRVVKLTVYAKGKTFDLGVTKKKRKVEEDGKEGEATERPLGPNVPVLILSGKFAERYGRVQSMDAATGRCDIRLADGTVCTVVETILQTISDEEFIKYGKVINKSSFDEYQRKEKNGETKRDDDRDKRQDEDRRKGRDEDRRKERRRREDSVEIIGSDSDREDDRRRERRRRDDSREYDRSSKKDRDRHRDDRHRSSSHRHRDHRSSRDDRRR